MHRLALGLTTALLLAASAALVPTQIATACSCIAITDAEALAKSLVAFEGVVADGPREVLPPQDPFTSAVVTFAVDNTLKGGPLPDRMAIRTDGMNSSCSLGFAVGQRWRIYAAVWDGRPLSTGGCSNNQLLAEGVPIPPSSPADEAPTGDDQIPLGVWVALAAAAAVVLASAIAFRRAGSGS
jgi:hypothetical protein